MNCLQLPHLRLTSPRARHVTRRPPRARISCTTRRNCPFVTASASESPGVQRSAPVHDVLGKKIPQNKKKHTSNFCILRHSARLRVLTHTVHMSPPCWVSTMALSGPSHRFCKSTSAPNRSSSPLRMALWSVVHPHGPSVRSTRSGSKSSLSAFWLLWILTRCLAS